MKVEVVVYIMGYGTLGWLAGCDGMEAVRALKSFHSFASKNKDSCMKEKGVLEMIKSALKK